MKYFNDCTNVEAVKRLYRELALLNHPDRGGDVRTMQEINAEYLIALKRLDGRVSFEDGKERTYKYDENKESALMEKIGELLKMRMAGVEIMLIGTWIWITGDTKPHKDGLKRLNCCWHNKRGCWYFHCDGHRSSYSRKGLGSLARKYGYAHFFAEEQKAIN